jgi:hypothetical protein
MMPQAQTPVSFGMRLPLDAPCKVVGNIPVTPALACLEELSLETTNKRKKLGEQGADRTKHAVRWSSSTCLQLGMQRSLLKYLNQDIVNIFYFLQSRTPTFGLGMPNTWPIRHFRSSCDEWMTGNGQMTIRMI